MTVQHTFQEFTGMQYLKIDVANNFGLDKKDWDERLEWFDNNEATLESQVKNADDPALYYASVKAYRKAQRKEVVQYPISLDATASGMQILACLTGDDEAAKVCNVINTGHRSDSYDVIYKHMQAVLKTTGFVEKNKVKSAVMTSLYGSEAQPRDAFGEGTRELAQFYNTMETLLPAVWELNAYFLKIWDSKALCYDWTMPDNYHVHIKVMSKNSAPVSFLGRQYNVEYSENRPVESGRSLSAHTAHSTDGFIVREMGRRCTHNPLRLAIIKTAMLGQKHPLDKVSQDDTDMVSTLWTLYMESGFLSARILDHLGADNLHLVDLSDIEELLLELPKKSFEILTVHDCFRCLANYGNDLRRQYNHLLTRLAKSNMLSFLLSQMEGKHVQITKKNPFMWKEIQHANYSLC